MRSTRKHNEYWQLQLNGWGRGTRWGWERHDSTASAYEEYLTSISGYWTPKPWPKPSPMFIPDRLPRGLREPPDAESVYNASAWFASPRLQKLLKDLVGDAVSFLPTRFAGEYGDLAKGYKFVKYRDTLDILHEDSWDIDEDTGNPYVVSPIIDLEKMPSGILIGNVSKSPSLAFVHDSVRRVLRDTGVTGLILTDGLPLKSNKWGQFKHDYVKKRKTKKE
jgi:hypothetical protein